MYAQLIESTTAPERSDQLSELIRRQLMTALRGQPGFSGAFGLLDCETGTSLLVVLWETDEEATRPLVQCGAPLLEALPVAAELSGGAFGAGTVWEVSARG